MPVWFQKSFSRPKNWNSITHRAWFIHSTPSNLLALLFSLLSLFIDLWYPRWDSWHLRVCRLYHYQSQQKEHFHSWLANKIPDLCFWLILGCIPVPEPITMAKWLVYSEWQGLDHVPIFGNWKLGLRVGRTASPKVKSIWQRGKLDAKKMDVGLCNYVNSYVNRHT